jgi:RND family efflux transporter MFP subunit
LAVEQAKSPRELEESEAVLAMARARLNVATALQLTYRLPGGESAVSGAALPSLELRAPIAGIVNRLHASVGEMVAPNTAVVHLIDPSMVWIEARIPEIHLGRLDTGIDTLYERLDALGIYRVIENRSGVYLGLEVDPQTRTAPITFEVQNGVDPLRIGQSVRLHVGTARAEQALALPDAAIVEEAGRPVAFIQVSGETFEKRELVLGIRDGPWVQVLEGVAEGERVVTEGAYVVRLASVSSVLPAHGHAH